MSIAAVTKVVYVLLGAMYVVVGAGSIALPAGWISPTWAGPEAAAIYVAQAPASYINHLTREFGTLAIAVGVVFLWQARRGGPSRSLHWLLTAYLALSSLIHWVGPQGPVGSLQRGLINSIPPVLLVILGLLQWRRSGVRIVPRQDDENAAGAR